MGHETKHRLRLVRSEDTLTGSAPLALERAAKRCVAGDATHRGLLRVAAVVARHGLRRVVAPSARPPLVEALETVEAWANGTGDLKRVRRKRAECFGQARATEETTLKAVRVSLQRPNESKSQLSTHAESVLWRYLRLAVRLAVDSVVLTLDAATEPPKLAETVQQIAGALAYQATALGAARQVELMTSAEEQAHFEVHELGGSQHAPQLLALQVYHEYLGVRWKVLHDAERAYIEQFVDWATASLG